MQNEASIKRNLGQKIKNLAEQGVRELRKSGFYKSLEKSLNSILKRLNKA